jgi:predicted extracellular nuclease
MNSLRLIFSAAFLAAAGHGAVVISKVYGGGGATTGNPTYNRDYVELFNNGDKAETLDGKSVQYASATGTSWQVTPLIGSIMPGQYILVGQGTAVNPTGGSLPAVDISGSIAMSAVNGKVAVAGSADALSGACPTAGVIDLVGYGDASAISCWEGSAPTGAIDNQRAVVRQGEGCVDTNDNRADFRIVLNATARNSATPLSPCGAAAPLTITTRTAQTAFINNPFSLTLAAGGGSGQGYVFALTGGALPPGFALARGVLRGTAETVSTVPFRFRIEVTDSAGNVAGADFTLTIAAPSCSPTRTIAEIQGSGDTSPLADQSVTTQGIVTALKSNGYFVQMPDAGDSDPATSDAILVFTSSAPPPNAVVGASVCVTGRVTEFIPTADPFSPSVTEITAPVTLALSRGNTLPQPVLLTAADTDPSGSLTQLERYEHMRVQVESLIGTGATQGTRAAEDERNGTSTSTGLFLGVLPGIGRPYREPGVQLPDALPADAPCCVPRFDGNPEVIAVDSDAQPGTAPIDAAAGATVANITGVLDYARRQYTILPDLDVTRAVAPDASAAPVPAPEPNELTIASLNMQRFFDTRDDAGISDVALTPEGFELRIAKASLAIRQVLRSPDILGVAEVENLTTLEALASRINADALATGGSDPGYRAYLVEGNDIGGIDVGFLVKAGITVDEVTQAGKADTYINPSSQRAETLNDRPPLLLRAAGLTVIMNHLRSLSDIDTPAVRAKRKAQAEFLAALIQSRQDAGEKVVVIGDFNAFQFNDGYVDVIGVIKGTPAPSDEVVLPAGASVLPELVNLVDSLPPDDRYSYNFSGSAQALDHILVNPAAAELVTRFIFARFNSDFPESYRRDHRRPERISDHDAPVVYIVRPGN